MKVSMLNTPPMCHRGRGIIQAMTAGAKKLGINVKSGYSQADRKRVLMTYGAGAPERLPTIKQHVESGGTAIMWDAGYWDRKLHDADRKYRVSINHLHPQEFMRQMDNKTSARMRDSGLRVVTKEHDNDGPILLVGNAPKARRAGAEGWSENMLNQLRQRLPDKKIIYRPKPKRIPEHINADGISTGPIEGELQKYSLIVCRHSNVGIDACMIGVPVVSEDGAASVIYPNRLDDYENQPTLAQRKQFMANLAYWQWSRKEMANGHAWKFLLEVLGES